MTDAWGPLVVDGIDRAGDRDLLGLDRTGPGRASFELTSALARFDGKLYGGTAIAAAVALAEAETGRPAIWTTVQFVSGASSVGDRFDCTTEVLAMGRRAAQVRVIARIGAEEIFCALAATALPKADGLTGGYQELPDVSGPDDSPDLVLPLPGSLRRAAASVRRNLEFRVARPMVRGASPSPFRLWARVPGRVATPAVISYVADMVPMAVAKAAGRAGGGTSLDNTMRFGPGTGHEWVLLDLDPHLAHGGYGHGTVHVWSPDGVLLATGSQTAALLLID